MGCLSVSISWLSYAVLCSAESVMHRSYLLENKATKFISDISMEIYLSHMAILRIAEKFGLNRIVGNGWLQYFVTAAIVLCGSIFLAVLMQRIIVCSAISQSGNFMKR